MASRKASRAAGSFEPDVQGFKSFGHSPAMLKMVFFVATQAALAAKALAPKDSGKYARSITADAGVNDAGEAVGRIKANDFKSHWIEFGTIKQPPSAPLTRAVEATTGQTPKDKKLA